jgi:hypothetical protein
MHVILGCFAIARNDEADFENPSGSHCEPAPLAGSKICSNREDTFIIAALYYNILEAIKKPLCQEKDKEIKSNNLQNVKN